MTTPSPRSEIDMVVVPYIGALGRIEMLSTVKTRLVQSQSLGYDGISELLPRATVFANAASVHEASTAELALTLVLASQRGIREFVHSSLEGHWAPAWFDSLADRTVMIIGHGGVGRAIEDRLAGFEVKLVRVAQHARSDERGEIHAVSSLPELLPDADIVIVIVPLDETTTHLVDDRFLSQLKDGALVVNVSRGRVFDTSAVITHAQRGRLRFALDVVDPEPLPDGHVLFTLENVLITPHVGGASSAMLPRIARLVNSQISRLLNGEEPLNVVLRT
ncbi:MAG: 2-hydroxyacid dehydrogenase [Acidimicrobiaceae bacterium]|nr:2-hydroxyacid dehydrogenase [Acidimicrobiaceae bacterium]